VRPREHYARVTFLAMELQKRGKNCWRESARIERASWPREKFVPRFFRAPLVSQSAPGNTMSLNCDERVRKATGAKEKFKKNGKIFIMIIYIFIYLLLYCIIYIIFIYILYYYLYYYLIIIIFILYYYYYIYFILLYCYIIILFIYLFTCICLFIIYILGLVLKFCTRR